MPDLMHEFELGVWKAIFTHILRVMFALGGDKIQEFNARYVRCSCNNYLLRIATNYNIQRISFRKVPTFGRDTIRRFGNNISGMKQLAARDFEDILQVRYS